MAQLVISIAMIAAAHGHIIGGESPLDPSKGDLIWCCGIMKAYPDFFPLETWGSLIGDKNRYIRNEWDEKLCNDLVGSKNGINCKDVENSRFGQQRAISPDKDESNKVHDHNFDCGKLKMEIEQLKEENKNLKTKVEELQEQSTALQELHFKNEGSDVTTSPETTVKPVTLIDIVTSSTLPNVKTTTTLKSVDMSTKNVTTQVPTTSTSIADDISTPSGGISKGNSTGIPKDTSGPIEFLDPPTSPKSPTPGIPKDASGLIGFLDPPTSPKSPTSNLTMKSTTPVTVSTTLKPEEPQVPEGSGDE